MFKPNAQKQITFFDFAPLNYGGGCEKNFMKFGVWLRKKNFIVNFITPSLSFNKIASLLPGISKYRANISQQNLRAEYGVTDYATFSFIDLIFRTKNFKNIRNTLRSSDIVYSKNELFEVFLLRYFFCIDPKKIIYGFHTPTHYPMTQSLKSKIHNRIYGSRVYFRALKGSRIRSLVLTEQDKTSFEKFGLESSFAVIPNPLDTAKFYQKEYLKEGPFKIYFLGRMTEQKGIDILAKVVELFSQKSEFKNVQFHFVGSGELERLLQNLSEKYENCFFEGFTTSVVNFYQKADLVIVPSRWEGFPYSVLEAQSCGIPVITSDVPGCRDIVNDKTGWICKTGDTNSYLTALLLAYGKWENLYEEYVLMGKTARKNIVENYQEDKINERILHELFEIYD